MSYINYDGYMITKDPLAPKSLFDNGGGGGGGGGDLPTGTDGQILINRNGEWIAENPDFDTIENVNSKIDAVNTKISTVETSANEANAKISTETSERKAEDVKLKEKSCGADFKAIIC